MASPRRDALVVAVATGTYGLSFGAVGADAGLSVAQTCTLSLLMFSGGSQFAFVGVVAAGGGLASMIVTPSLLGSRNLFYGVRLSRLLGVGGLRRAVAAHLVIDESTAMAIGRDDPDEAREAFWWTGAGIFALWNLATLLGALGAGALSDPRVYGLDAAGPAAFVALLTPRLKGREPWSLALGAAVLAAAVTPWVPAGVPVLCAALLAIATGLRSGGT